ncbi:hypothetical protein OIU74_021461 [Salix koriyanagi]|uniref:Uncharacterized protein n=1 Tax=Salix koriyanagi TaxID=2511006 RepID=A0A9Q0WI57_9ROSI|nr:hypothetical protein OIU74_021461 [Salix koriyanagi]
MYVLCTLINFAKFSSQFSLTLSSVILTPLLPDSSLLNTTDPSKLVGLVGLSKIWCPARQHEHLLKEGSLPSFSHFPSSVYRSAVQLANFLSLRSNRLWSEDLFVNV